MTELNDMVEKVKQVDDGVNNIIVPILKDTIKDSNKHNTRLFIINILLVFVTLIISLAAIIIVTKQNDKYAEFLSQFEFESDIIQDLEANDNGNIVNPIINNTK